MTRRRWLSLISTTSTIPGVKAAAGISDLSVSIPVHLLFDGKVSLTAAQKESWARLWAEAARNLRTAGIELKATDAEGEVWRPSGRQPVIYGLVSGSLNLVITDRIPMVWDRGRALSGVAMRYRGHHLCMIALRRAHGHQVPIIGVNTCLHELLHVLMLDIFEDRPGGFIGAAREARIDLYATRLWLLGDGKPIRASADAYLRRLESDAAFAAVR